MISDSSEEEHVREQRMDEGVDMEQIDAPEQVDAPELVDAPEQVANRC